MLTFGREDYLSIGAADHLVMQKRATVGLEASAGLEDDRMKPSLRVADLNAVPLTQGAAARVLTKKRTSAGGI